MCTKTRDKRNEYRVTRRSIVCKGWEGTEERRVTSKGKDGAKEAFDVPKNHFCSI